MNYKHCCPEKQKASQVRYNLTRFADSKCRGVQYCVILLKCFQQTGRITFDADFASSYNGRRMFENCQSQISGKYDLIFLLIKEIYLYWLLMYYVTIDEICANKPHRLRRSEERVLIILNCLIMENTSSLNTWIFSFKIITNFRYWRIRIYQIFRETRIIYTP